MIQGNEHAIVTAFINALVAMIAIMLVCVMHTTFTAVDHELSHYKRPADKGAPHRSLDRDDAVASGP